MENQSFGENLFLEGSTISCLFAIKTQYCFVLFLEEIGSLIREGNGLFLLPKAGVFD